LLAFKSLFECFGMLDLLFSEQPRRSRPCLKLSYVQGAADEGALKKVGNFGVMGAIGHCSFTLPKRDSGHPGQQDTL
jgi:hypothetical protein